ncbi:hypothetical protein [Compostimonas suwonensis]|uniref:Uncharacterized protein n=1 Tax=Compostimonas suwonensis TaxID=1048394 RepID=A0A2M9C0F4_9MICO|nr:hypothetical protein [Compostimonas suwonensis]PJJ63804.1 hypothetical protein CLV54_1480 [Compostimonas suwonensis]
MRKNLVIIAVVAAAAYLIGVESAKSRGKDYEDLRHQLERLWTSPEARKSRKRLAKSVRKSVKDRRQQLRRLAN